MGINVIRRDDQSGDQFVNDFQVFLENGRSFGKFINGDTVPATGKTAAEVILEAAQQRILPAYILPVANITSNFGVGYREVGEAVALQLSRSYTQNDGGTVTYEAFYKNNVLLSGANPYTDNIVLSETPILYKSRYDHLAGTNQKLDNMGDITNNTIGAGTVYSSDLSIRGYYRIWYGALTSMPGSGAAIRSAGYAHEPDGKTFTINTGTIYRHFTIASRTPLVEVEDLDTGLDVTSGYILSGITQVPDANGVMVNYYVYVMENGIPYSTNHRHQFTIQ